MVPPRALPARTQLNRAYTSTGDGGVRSGRRRAIRRVEIRFDPVPTAGEAGHLVGPELVPALLEGDRQRDLQTLRERAPARMVVEQHRVTHGLEPQTPQEVAPTELRLDRGRCRRDVQPPQPEHALQHREPVEADAAPA